MKHFLQWGCYGILALLSQNSYSQDILWERSFGGKHADYLYDIQPTADYGFIVAGSSLSGKAGSKTISNKGDMDYWLWKMDEKGELDWQKSFGGPGTDILNSVKVTSDGGFILAGTSSSGKGEDKSEDSHGKNDFWVIKLDAGGGVQWEKTYGGPGNDELVVAHQTKDGGFILGGNSSSDSAGNKSSKCYGANDYWIVKLDSGGNLKWEKSFGGQFADLLTDLRPTHDNGFIAIGYSNSPESGNKIGKNYGTGDFWILKLDSEGVTQWQKVYGGDKDDYPSTIRQLEDGGYIAGGHSNSPAGNERRVSARKGSDMWVIRLNAEGESVWQESYDYGNTDMLTSITVNDDGTFLLSGFSRGIKTTTKKAGKEINDYIAIKIDEKGEVKWDKVIGSDGIDVLRASIETRDGGYLLAGTSDGKASRDKSSGVGRGDFWLVKLLDKEKKKKKPQVIEAIPNPALEYTNVIVGYEYDKGTASIYDLGGRMIQTFSVEGRTIPVNLNGLPEGIYIIQVKTDKSTDSVKVIKGISKN